MKQNPRVQLFFGLIVLLLSGCEESDPGFNIDAPGNCTVALEGDVYLASNLPSLRWPVKPHLDKAILMAATQINGGGGIGFEGSTLGIISCDTQGDIAIGVENVLALSELPLVAGIIGAARSAVTMGSTPEDNGTCKMGSSKEIVSISPGSTNDQLGLIDDDDYCYRTCASDSIQGRVQASVAETMGCTKVLYISDVDDSYTTGLMNNFIDALSPTLEGVGKEFTMDTHTADAVLAQLRSADYNCLGSSLFTKDIAPILNRISSEPDVQSLKIIVGDGAHSNDFLNALTRTTLDFLKNGNLQATKPGCTESTHLFKSRYLAIYGNEDEEFDHSAYDATLLFATAMSILDDPTDRTGIRDLLRDGKLQTGAALDFQDWAALKAEAIKEGTVNYEGAAGAHDFEPDGDVDGNIWVGEIRDGHFTGSTTYKSCWGSDGNPLQ